MSRESDQNLIGIVEKEVDIQGTAEDFLQIFTDKPNNISKVSSDIVQDCELVEGEWGSVGSIVCWTYNHDGQKREVKERVEAIDKEKHLIKLRVLDGDIADYFKSFVVTLQGVPKPDNPKHCVIHWRFEYEKHHGVIFDPHHSLLELAIELSKEIEAHIRDDEAP